MMQPIQVMDKNNVNDFAIVRVSNVAVDAQELFTQANDIAFLLCLLLIDFGLSRTFL